MSEVGLVISPARISPQLVALWLTDVHGGLCRIIGGGLLARLPFHPDFELSRSGRPVRELAVLLADCDLQLIEREARRVSSDEYLICMLADDITSVRPTVMVPHLALTRVLSELKNYCPDDDNLSKELQFQFRKLQSKP